MTDDFDPSPRALKRRRTARYGSQRTTLTDDEAQVHYGEAQVQREDGDCATKSDIAGVNTPTKQTAVTKTSSRHPRNRTDHIDSLSSEEDDALNGPETTTFKSKQKARGRRTAPVQEVDSATTNSRARVNGAHGDVEVAGEDATEELQDSTPQPRSSGRQRRPPRRLLDTVADEEVPKRSKATSAMQSETVELVPASPALRGILTPSKKQRAGGGPRKSVMFDQDEREIEEQFGFRDINTPAPKRLPKKATPHPKKSKSLIQDTNQHASVQDVADTQPSPQDEFVNDMLIDEPPEFVPALNLLSEPVKALGVVSSDAPQLQIIKQNILSRLTSSSLPQDPPAHLQTQYSQLHTLLKATVESSESNSLLLLGPRGAGKSLLLDLAILALAESTSVDFHTVHLNGFLQTDDRLALREIWRQLGHSRDLDESETEDIGASYADTMASLLSLLSHPDEMAMNLSEDQAVQRTSKSIVFILDEFDLFTTHPRQTLLYNLFDIAQSRKAPIAVVGCSTRMDVIECLEKRVKSRFSHRWLLVPGCKNYSEWEAEVKRALLTGEEPRRTKEEEKWATRWDGYIEKTLLAAKEVQHLIKSQFYATKSLPELYMALYPIIAMPEFFESGSDALPTHKGTQYLVPHSILSVIPTVPVLHLSLLISMCRLETIHILTTSNFNLVYTHYTELIQTSRLKQAAYGSLAHSGTLRQWNRETCRGAWEELGSWGIIVPVVGGGNRDEDGGLGAGGGAEVEETRMWRSEISLDDVLWGVQEKFEMVGMKSGGGAGEVLAKWCREV